MKVIVEQRLRFEFGSSWQVEKYDEHLIYRKGIESLKEQIPCTQCWKPREVGSKAVDFVGRRKEQIYFIEVKDFRRHPETKKRRRHDLPNEVALKVRDTLAGLVGALHRHDTRSWRPLIAPLFEQPLNILLWLEEDPPRKPGAREISVNDVLRQRLSWLSPHVTVANQRNPRPAIDLHVSDLPNHVYNLREIVKERERERTYISTDDFCRAWAVPPQAAGIELKKLCEKGILKRVAGNNDWFAPDTEWEQLHEDPSRKPA